MKEYLKKEVGAGQSFRGRGRERKAGSSWHRLEQRTENIKGKKMGDCKKGKGGMDVL